MIYFSCRSRGDIFSRRYKVPVEPNYRQIEKQILDDVLGPTVYDPRIRPAGQNTTGRGEVYLYEKGMFMYDISMLRNVNPVPHNKI